MEHENASRGKTRPPSLDDVKRICAALNTAGVKYALIGGLAINYYGYPRATQDIDFLIDPSEENVMKIRDALSFLPDGASKELRPDDVKAYSIVRIADEIVIDLIGSVGDINYNSITIEFAHIDGTRIPIADIDSLIKTKQGLREKDATDRTFLLMLKEAKKKD